MGHRDNASRGQPRILHEVLLARLLALAPVLGFGVLVAVLTAAGELPPWQGVWVVAAVAAAFSPTGWVAPGGWRRRLAEAALLPIAYVLTMLGDPTLRHFALPPLLVLGAWAAAAAALASAPSRLAPLLVGSLGVAVRAAGGLGLTGYPLPLVLAVVAASGAVPAALGHRWGPRTGIAAALLVPWLPYAEQPWLLAGAAAAVATALLLPRVGEPLEPLAARWVGHAAAVALIAAALAPWGGMPLERLFPAAGWLAGIGAVLALVLAGRCPPALAGAAWLGVACLLGPPQPAPPDRAGVTLTAAAPAVTLPPGDGDRYVLDLALANAGALATGTPVAEIGIGGETRILRAGEDTAEWAHERPDVRAAVGHPLPRRPVWRPQGEGRGALWGVGGRVELEVPAGVAPVLRRAPELPPQTSVAVSTAGPSRPTPPRTWTLPTWVAATALVVALLQLLGATWRQPFAAVPWVLLAAGVALARAPVEPLRLLLERHGVDLCLVALLAAWLPAARRWLARRRVFVAAAALLLPLALATPRLTPPLYGDEPFHLIVLESLARDRDVDIANNLDLERSPYNRIYQTGKVLMHSPALATMLLPGYLLAGRTGALVLLALAGALLAALLAQRARQLGVGEEKVAVLVLLLCLTYPLATFATQVWVELPGALAAALALLLVVYRPSRRWAVVVVAAAAAAVKTRLALVTFPLAMVAWWPGKSERRRRPLAIGLAVLILAALASLAVGWYFLGHPFGYFRRLHHLLPRSLQVVATVLGGLIFDPAGGLAFTAPLLLLALAGVPQLWRRGGPGERALLLGALATVLALLHNREWYGGGAPPARYLVPLLPAVALAGAFVLARGRALVTVMIAPSVLAWWLLLTRPHLSINPGDGGWWLGGALARRFAADTRALFPSFLVPTAATGWVPVALVLAAAGAWLVLRRRPGARRALGRLAVPLWLAAAAALVATLAWRTDRVVELEAAQVVRRGGAPEPPEGTFSRFVHRNGWRLRPGDGVTVPLRLPANAGAELEAMGAGLLEASWESGESWTIQILTPTFARFPLPAPPGPGRQHLHLRAIGEGHGEVVLDRLEVGTP